MDCAVTVRRLPELPHPSYFSPACHTHKCPTRANAAPGTVLAGAAAMALLCTRGRVSCYAGHVNELMRCDMLPTPSRLVSPSTAALRPSIPWPTAFCATHLLLASPVSRWDDPYPVILSFDPVVVYVAPRYPGPLRLIPATASQRASHWMDRAREKIE